MEKCIYSANGRVTIPSYIKDFPVTHICNAAFYHLSGLTELVIPSTVKYVSDYITLGCPNLKTIICEATTPPQASSSTIISDICWSCTLYVPKGYKSQYKEANGWKNFYYIREIGVEEVNISIDATNFPDANFRNYLMKQKYGNDGVLSEDEVERVTSLDLCGWDTSEKIASLKGIEYFKALTSLDCSGNQLTSLNIAYNTALTDLDCSGNKLTALDITQNIALTSLDCSGNLLTALDIEQNTALTDLDCSGNQLKSLGMSSTNNTSLKYLDVSSNHFKGWSMDKLIESLPYNFNNSNRLVNVIKTPERDENVCSTRQVAAIKAKGWTPRRAFYVPPYGAQAWEEYEGSEPFKITIDAAHFPDVNFRNHLMGKDCGRDGVISEDELEQVRWIDVSGSYNSSGNIVSLQGIEFFSDLYHLDCSYNQVASLDVSRNINLTTLFCRNNQLTSLDISKNLALFSFSCENNQLTSLDVSKNIELTSLHCYNNQLTSLDVTQNKAIKYLYCNNNQLTSLDVSKNTVLEIISCGGNQLSSLDVSNNTVLKELSCGKNQLTSLDVSKNTVLKELSCGNNQLISLDVSNNSTLTYLSCYNNQIKGRAMDNLINSLPWVSSNNGEFYVVSTPDTDGNVCTKTQVAAARAKGWISYYYDSTDKKWKEYEGSDPTGIDEVWQNADANAPIYNLNGQRLDKPRKGINIIGGKKVYIK